MKTNKFLILAAFAIILILAAFNYTKPAFSEASTQNINTLLSDDVKDIINQSCFG